MNASTVAIIVVIVVVIWIWKKVTAKLLKLALGIVAIALIAGTIYMIATGKRDMLPGGKSFEKCFYDQKKTEYFCTKHIQWECEKCHKKNK